jgi:NAD-dependent dihydropyrimidine dehydrogenase PreA subunit
MIEIINSERCIKCNLCVLVCPVNVFDKVKRGVPVIARQADCQTCYMCELYCPVDAMYVSPLADACETVQEQQILEKGLLGSYREVVGWGEGRQPGAASDRMYVMYEPESQPSVLPHQKEASP